MSCSGEMLRDDIEHQLRRQLTKRLLTLRHESVGIKQD
jgi:outer membrane lipopolysaccharide assembly protein LptE/RlpB